MDFRTGEYGIVLGERFIIEVSGNVAEAAKLESAAQSLDLAGLEALGGSP